MKYNFVKENNALKLRDFSISKFNETMQKDVSKQKLNFCKAIILSHKKISVTLEYKPTLFHKQYAILKPDLSVDFRNDFTSYYYGASPKIDSFSVIDAISKLSFTTSEGLDTYISKHCAEFMLHEDQAEYLPDIARLILLTVSSKYGIRIKFCDELNFLLSDESDFSETVSHRPQ